MHIRRRPLGRAIRDQQGTAIVEMAIVLVLFLSLAWGIISFGYAYMLKENLTHATQEGLRAVQNAPAGTTLPASRAAACPYYNGGPGTTTPLPSDVRPYYAACKAYDTIIHTLLSSAQADSGITVTVSDPTLPGSCGAADPDPQAECLTITMTFDNSAANGDNPVPPALPGISNFIPSAIRATATGKV